MGHAFVFRRKLGFPLPRGGTAGHVAWAFEIAENGPIYCGSTENYDVMPWHAVGEDNSWWGVEADGRDAMLGKMREHMYDDYKLQRVDVCDPKKAKAVADNCRLAGYSFTGNNCLDHVYQILFHYGSFDMPLPLDIGYPNGWFSALAWQWHEL